MFNDLAELIDEKMAVQTYSTQALLVGAVMPLLADDGIGTAAATLTIALLKRFESDSRYDLVTPAAIDGLRLYSERVPGDHAVKRWLEGHAGTPYMQFAPARPNGF